MFNYLHNITFTYLYLLYTYIEILMLNRGTYYLLKCRSPIPKSKLNKLKPKTLISYTDKRW